MHLSILYEMYHEELFPQANHILVKTILFQKKRVRICAYFFPSRESNVLKLLDGDLFCMGGNNFMWQKSCDKSRITHYVLNDTRAVFVIILLKNNWCKMFLLIGCTGESDPFSLFLQDLSIVLLLPSAWYHLVVNPTSHLGEFIAYVVTSLFKFTAHWMKIQQRKHMGKNSMQISFKSEEMEELKTSNSSSCSVKKNCPWAVFGLQKAKGNGMVYLMEWKK